ncbi:hypothetical protein CONPUDRAFT_135191 [Coniophora puteana RWD-64-598 SS2]|uniref:FYVE-type domain-containing protein n=1 Tax=Coniophora puteana (strain RWD-64-598) TaxID=741705 RepID=A0A5M3N226_CONPW|nr:uncharacterized protein CONPUDRAFT_135191 [Coniophora puteana RWD-64-598 SS2]EIW85440.1 hypothetical protein CONPUDRAFT_135191 [Coniophora puteana RWD-64-598 SS2]
MSSSPTPVAVPYQAYRSKRHGRTSSANFNNSAPSSPPLQASRPSSMVFGSPGLNGNGGFSLTNGAPNGNGVAPLAAAAEIFPVERKAPITPEANSIISVFQEEKPIPTPTPTPEPISIHVTPHINGPVSRTEDSLLPALPIIKVESASTAPINGDANPTENGEDGEVKIDVDSPTTPTALASAGASVNGPQNGKDKRPEVSTSPPSSNPPVASPPLQASAMPSSPPSSSTSKPLPGSRKISTFRRVPLRPSPLNPEGSSTSPRSVSTSVIPSPQQIHTRLPSKATLLPRQLDPPAPPPKPAHAQPLMHQRTISSGSSTSPLGSSPTTISPLGSPFSPTPPTGSLMPSPMPGSSLRNSPLPSPASARAPILGTQSPPARTPIPQTPAALAAPYAVRTNLHSTTPSSSAPATPSMPLPGVAPPGKARTTAPYRPGFQPKGVYRPRTDAFIEARNAHLDEARIERTKLERRFEKLVTLHFPAEEKEKGKERGRLGSGSGSGFSGSAGAAPAVAAAVAAGQKRPGVGLRGGPGAKEVVRRSSSFFDPETWKGLKPGELWKGVVSGGEKDEIRVAEQRIAPWADDSSESACPICTTSFHPLTNRRHHCRLCGKLVCASPPAPGRTACSIRFVVDGRTRAIEEVGEGVDYGVRRRTSSISAGDGKGKGKGKEEDEDKFLKGVRVCAECRPVLIRRQYYHSMSRIPPFARYYDALISLEKEIGEDLPQFQELVLSLSQTPDAHPPKEATAARKRLLDAFSSYDALSKRILSLPTPGGRGSSQDRVQRAIGMRATAFLQQNMVGLQALPKPTRRATNGSGTPSTPGTPGTPATEVSDGRADALDESARALQPLLEQEALLEGFVEEAMAHRKFEDARTLRKNLAEIRGEISRIVGTGGVVPPS